MTATIPTLSRATEASTPPKPAAGAPGTSPSTSCGVIRNYGVRVLATAFGTPLLYLFAFGVGLATLVNANLGPGGVDGVSYLQFVAPALICAAADHGRDRRSSPTRS